jgi:hypothetical protein
MAQADFVWNLTHDVWLASHGFQAVDKIRLFVIKQAPTFRSGFPDIVTSLPPARMPVCRRLFWFWRKLGGKNT